MKIASIVEISGTGQAKRQVATCERARFSAADCATELRSFFSLRLPQVTAQERPKPKVQLTALVAANRGHKEANNAIQISIATHAQL
jgi:hypothetical protein